MTLISTFLPEGVVVVRWSIFSCSIDVGPPSTEWFRLSFHALVRSHAHLFDTTAVQFLQYRHDSGLFARSRRSIDENMRKVARRGLSTAKQKTSEPVQ